MILSPQSEPRLQIHLHSAINRSKSQKDSIVANKTAIETKNGSLSERIFVERVFLCKEFQNQLRGKTLRITSKQPATSCLRRSAEMRKRENRKDVGLCSLRRLKWPSRPLLLCATIQWRGTHYTCVKMPNQTMKHHRHHRREETRKSNATMMITRNGNVLMKKTPGTYQIRIGPRCSPWFEQGMMLAGVETSKFLMAFAKN
mmetsp:Transcript_19490/g.42010  ORF Transcript_19490/g.42010 Transcript_19490/m.42010 type:complete len:201 (+) Transcript_19490:372-974(+)